MAIDSQGNGSFAMLLIKKIFHYLALCFIFLQGFWFVHRLGVNLLYWDEWDGVDTVLKFLDNELTIQYLFSQHNEHRLFFPRLIILVVGVLSDVNTVCLMYCSQLLLVATIIFLYFELREELAIETRQNRLWLSLPVFLLPFFSFRNGENFLWGFQISFVLVFCTTISSLLLLNRFVRTKYNLYFVGAILLGIVSSFSSLQGLFVWFVGFVFLILNCFPSKKIKLKHLLIWFVVAASCFALYFVGYVKPDNHPSFIIAFQNFGDVIHNFFQFTGVFFLQNPIQSEKAGLSQLLFAAILLYACYKSKGKNFAEIALPAALISYTFLFGVSVAVARVGFSPAMKSRYFLFFCPLLVGIMLLLEKLAAQYKTFKYIKTIYFSMFLIWFATSQNTQFYYWLGQCESRIELREKLINGSMSDEEMSKIYPVKDRLQMQIEKVKEKKLNIFAEQ